MKWRMNQKKYKKRFTAQHRVLRLENPAIVDADSYWYQGNMLVFHFNRSRDLSIHTDYLIAITGEDLDG